MSRVSSALTKLGFASCAKLAFSTFSGKSLRSGSSSGWLYTAATHAWNFWAASRLFAAIPRSCRCAAVAQPSNRLAVMMTNAARMIAFISVLPSKLSYSQLCWRGCINPGVIASRVIAARIKVDDGSLRHHQRTDLHRVFTAAVEKVAETLARGDRGLRPNRQLHKTRSKLSEHFEARFPRSIYCGESIWPRQRADFHRMIEASPAEGERAAGSVAVSTRCGMSCCPVASHTALSRI